MKSRRFLVAALLVAACSDDPIETDPPLNVDRPVDVAFACGRSDATVAPLAECATASRRPLDTVENDGDSDPSDDTYNLFFYAFALESETGTLAISRYPALRDAPAVSGDGERETAWFASQSNVDVDPFAPRVNGIAVGATPVAVTTDRDACHLVTANAGSCDLSVVDVTRLLANDGSNLSARVAVVDGAGQPVLARPAAMVAEPEGTTATCQASPGGLVYVAYPGCHTVAAIVAGTGQIVAHIDFAADGTATVVRDGNLSCPAECGAAVPGTAGPRPTTLDLLADTRAVSQRLAIGTENGNQVTIVDLDATFLPVAARQVALEGDVGVIDVALTPTMSMGGSDGLAESGDDVGGLAQFVYAITTDGTVRVAEILQAAPVECDTQIDPRYLGNAELSQLSCLPVGSPSLPRRAGALGPGIELTGTAIPTAVTVARNPLLATHYPDANNDNKADTMLDPASGQQVLVAQEPILSGRAALVGTFAYVASSVGVAFIVNIDDDSFLDREDPTNPLAIELTQALPHSLRDQVENRSGTAVLDVDTDGNAETPAVRYPSCVGEPDPEAADPTGGTRLAGLVARQSDTSNLASANLGNAPGLRQVTCVGNKLVSGSTTEVEPTSVAVSELAFTAPPAQRAAAFPDLAALPFSHFWRFTWEGLFVDEVRQGLVPVDGTGMRLTDGAKPFCALGVEPFDNVTFIGCDPTRGDLDCGVGETCFVHPDAQTGTAGACLPESEVDFLAGPCRDFLIARRRYAVAQSEAGQLKLAERRRVLRTTPVTGCVDAPQCEVLARQEHFMANAEEPFERDADDEPAPKNWTCEPDPSRGGSINRCQQRCNDDLPRNDEAEAAIADAATCGAGNVCSQKGVDGWGYCVEGVVPPLQCVRGRQRYLLRGTDAFVITHVAAGDTGPATYDHAIVADSAGACVRDPAANRLQVSRIPLRPAPCTDDGSSPNPCFTQVEHTEDYLKYETSDVACDTNAAQAGRQLTRTRREPPRVADAIRVEMPGFTTHVVDPTYPGDLVCRGDRLGGLVDVPFVGLGTQIAFRIASGFAPHTVSSAALVYPVNIVRGPDDTVWLVDEGKQVNSSYRGGLLRYNPATGRGLQID
jgi:hypothetical protein